MLYYQGIEDVIFSRHEITSKEPDELIIISGFLGPKPVERLKELPFKVTVIAGMYRNGMDMRLYNALLKAQNENKNLTLYYTNIEIHSKIYIWKNKGEVLSALIGSANFSSNGIRTDFRESLADATRDTHISLDNYYNFIINNSSTEAKTYTTQKKIDYTHVDTTFKNYNPDFSNTINIPLFNSKTQEVPPRSGLNWGFSKGHVALGDAYIRIPKEALVGNEHLIPPFDPDFETKKGKKKRNSDPIEIIWDDGYTMSASLEAWQLYQGKKYPKQLTSFSSKQPFLNGEKISKKSILGRYLRNRLGVSLEHLITFEDLENYGRTDIALTLIEPGIYYLDFSITN